MPEPKDQLNQGEASGTEQASKEEPPKGPFQGMDPKEAAEGLARLRVLFGSKTTEQHCWESKNIKMLEVTLERLKKKTIPKPGTLVHLDHKMGVVVGLAKFPFKAPNEAKFTGRPWMGIKLDTEVVLPGDDNHLRTGIECGSTLFVIDNEELVKMKEESDRESPGEFEKAMENASRTAMNLASEEVFEPGDKVTWKLFLSDRKMTGTFLFLRYIKAVACEKDGPEDGSYVDCQILCETHEAPCIFQVEARRLRKV